MLDELPELLEFCCPRCSSAVSEVFYGPCSPCREQLRHSGLEHSEGSVPVAYEPKMNVTPNFIATKD